MKELITSDKCYVRDGCKKQSQNTCNELFCIRLYKIDELYNNSLLTFTQRQPLKLMLDNNLVDEGAYTLLQSYQQNIVSFVESGNNIYIHSATSGNGKTSWAIKLIQAYIQKVWASSDLTCKALFINVPNFSRELKLNIQTPSEYIQHINKYASTADLVVWDDIGTKYASEFEHEQLISIIDTRIDNNKSNIFTSNIPPSELTHYLGERLTSRIIGLSKTIQFNGSDKRGWNA